jgi:hypothetical protein
MTRFGYWRDPLCLVSSGLYVANRWVVKPHVASPFFHGQFDDLLLIPCALPLVLWLQRRLRLRLHDRSPTGKEILFHLVVWTILFEVLGPHLMRVTGDPRDAVAYAAGAAVAWLWWRHRVAEA